MSVDGRGPQGPDGADGGVRNNRAGGRDQRALAVWGFFEEEGSMYVELMASGLRATPVAVGQPATQRSHSGTPAFTQRADSQAGTGRLSKATAKT